jgi:hypothetical protein
MADRRRKLRAGEGFRGTIIIKPVLARLEARDDGVTSSGKVF